MGRRLEQLEEFGIDVVLERRHGVRASVLRDILYALSFVYDRLVQVRLYLYHRSVGFRYRPSDSITREVVDTSFPRVRSGKGESL